MSDAAGFGLSKNTLERLCQVFAAHPAITEVLIYGSRAKGNYRHGSDIDLTIKGEPISFDRLLELQSQIDDLMLPYTIDLSQYAQIDNPDLVSHINRVGKVIYQSNVRHE